MVVNAEVCDDPVVLLGGADVVTCEVVVADVREEVVALVDADVLVADDVVIPDVVVMEVADVVGALVVV